MFPRGWDAESAAFAPAAIVGTVSQLEGLMKESIPSLTHALVALIRPGEPGLSRQQRENLWKAFRVPVFQQIVDERGTLLAAECEGHDGLHIESPKFVVAEEQIDNTPCGCGRTTPRVKTADPVRAVAAYAR